MATVEIDPQYEEWVQENVVKRFEKMGVGVTPAAQDGLAFLLQAQVREQIASNADEVFERANRLLVPVLRGHAARYQKQPLTLNRALHLVVDANIFVNAFPWGPSLEQVQKQIIAGGTEFAFGDVENEKEEQH